MSKTSLLHTPDKQRWFVVPEGVQLTPGTLLLRSFDRNELHVDARDVAVHQVSREQASAWVDARFEASFAKAGEAFEQFAATARRAVRSRGVETQDPTGGAISATDLFGTSAGTLYTDPSQARSAVEQALRSLGAGLRAAAQRVRERKADVEHRRAPQRPTRLLRAGFFAELRHGDPDAPSLSTVLRPAAGPLDARLVAYLRSAPVLIASPGPVSDVLAPHEGPIGTPSVHTDGVWCWPGDLAHYVERHHAAVPEAFAKHVEARGFDVGSPDLSAVCF